MADDRPGIISAAIVDPARSMVSLADADRRASAAGVAGDGRIVADASPDRPEGEGDGTAVPLSVSGRRPVSEAVNSFAPRAASADRKRTRLTSSHYCAHRMPSSV